LRFKALRFKDGTTAIAPGAQFGFIDFTVAGLPALLPAPTPAFFLGTQFTATQTATQAVVDANVIWLLDANGDFVFDTNPAANWNAAGPLPQIAWQHVPGAARYHVWARNTTSAGGNAGPSLQ